MYNSSQQINRFVSSIKIGSNKENAMSCKGCSREGEECEGCNTEGKSAAELISIFTEGMTEEEKIAYYENLLETEGLAPI